MKEGGNHNAYGSIGGPSTNDFGTNRNNTDSKFFSLQNITDTTSHAGKVNETANSEKTLYHDQELQMTQIADKEKDKSKQPEKPRFQPCGFLGNCFNSVFSLLKDKIVNLGGIALPYEYDGGKKWNHWIAYLFVILAVALSVILMYNLLENAGKVISVLPAEPINRAMKGLAVMAQFFQGGIKGISLDSLPKGANTISFFNLVFKTCEEYYSSLNMTR